MESTLWTNCVFIIVTAILLVSLLYQYLLPWHLATQIIKKHGRDPRPRVFFRFLLFTVLALFFSSILNVLFYAQATPSPTATSEDENQGPSLRIQNLSLNGWIALMVLATIAQQVPYALVYLTLLNVLQSRWYALVRTTNEHKTTQVARVGSNEKPTFLGWKHKEPTSFFLAFLLVFLPILSRIVLAVGLGTLPNPMAVEGADQFDKFDRLQKVVGGLDGLRAGITFIALVDLGASAYFLGKRLRAAGYHDSITNSVFRIFVPLIAVLTAQIVVASAVQTAGPTPTDPTDRKSVV